jgi:hypothetical protein
MALAGNQTQSRPRVTLAAAMVLLPAAIFCAVLIRYCVNIPSLDDYGAGLNYLNQSTQISTLSGRLLYLLAAQQNEYKIVFGHAVVWLQYAVFGNVDFRLTCLLGDVFVLFIGGLLWKMFLPNEKDLARRLALFAPVSLLLFQLNYAETLNWALPGLQNINIVFFSLLAIYLLVKQTQSSFWGAIAMLVLAISTSGNGFFIVPVGIMILAIDRHYGRIAIWLGATALCIGGYAYHYDMMSSQSPKHHSILAALLHLNPLYAVAFTGATAYRPHVLSLVLGFALLGFFIFMLRRGYWRKNPLVCYCVVFLLLTAVGVAGIRSELGLESAVASRYRIYSDLFLIFAWLAFVEEFLAARRESLRGSRSYKAALAAAALLFLLGDAWGVVHLKQRNRGLEQGMALYEHPEVSGAIGPVLVPVDKPEMQGFAVYARGILKRSIELHIYSSPQF